MSYRVILNERAEEQFEAAYLWWLENRSAEQAASWYNGFLNSLHSLGDNPERCGLARENRRFSIQVRELLYGLGRRTTHRPLFTVRRDVVFVFSIRHVSQQDVSPDDV